MSGMDEWQARENQRMREHQPGEDSASRLWRENKLQGQVIEQMRADYEVIGEKYLNGQKEIEQLQEEVVANIVALKAENNRLRLVLKDIYYGSTEVAIRNMAWDAAHSNLDRTVIAHQAQLAPKSD